MKTIEITVNRESVCLGDDIDDHVRKYYLSPNDTYMDLLQLLIDEKYFPNVSGNNVVWVLTTSEYFSICTYYTLTQKKFEGLAKKRLGEICRLSNEIFIKYYSSPLKWKEKIEMSYNSDTYTMWRDGWLDEFKYCDYVMSLSKI